LIASKASKNQFANQKHLNPLHDITITISKYDAVDRVFEHDREERGAHHSPHPGNAVHQDPV
jgi:hypothetical protein